MACAVALRAAPSKIAISPKKLRGPSSWRCRPPLLICTRPSTTR